MLIDPVRNRFPEKMAAVTVEEVETVAVIHPFSAPIIRSPVVVVDVLIDPKIFCTTKSPVTTEAVVTVP